MARGRFLFWLDFTKDHELMIAEEIDALKRHRLFTRTIRDGIRLIVDLRKGKTDVLCELFPKIVEKLRTPYDAQIRSLQSLVDDLTTLVATSESGRPPLVSRSVDVEIREAAPSNINATDNLLNAVAGLL